MRIIYIDEKDLHLYIEKESFRIKYKKNGRMEFWEDEITYILRTQMGSRRMKWRVYPM